MLGARGIRNPAHLRDPARATNDEAPPPKRGRFAQKRGLLLLGDLIERQLDRRLTLDGMETFAQRQQENHPIRRSGLLVDDA